MELYLLDTDAVIDYLTDTPSSVQLIENLSHQGNLCICDIVIAEVYSGLYPDAVRSAANLLNAMRFLVTSREMAVQAGEWRYQYARKGVTLSLTDALIAATGYKHQASVVTANVKDYQMSELSLIPLPRVKPSKN